MIKNKLTSLLSASLFLAACSGPQNALPTLNTGTAGLAPEQTSQSSEQINAPVIDANLPNDGGYRSLVITAQNIKGADFKTKQLFSVAPRRGVTIRIGTIDYTLSYRFMNKLRTLLIDANYVATNGAVAKGPAASYAGVVPAGFFTRLKLTGKSSLVADFGNPLWCSEVAPASTPTGCVSNPNPDAYTLSASELAFANLLETYNFVSLPDFMQEDEGTVESSDSHDALTDLTRNIQWVSTKVIRKEFYQKLDSYLNDDRNTGGYSNDLITDDFVFYSENLNPAATIVSSNIKTNNYDQDSGAGSGVNPTGSLYRMNVAAASIGGLVPLSTIGTPLVPAASTAEKALLASLVTKAPFIPNVGLLNGTGGVVVRNLGIGFGLQDTLAPSGTATTPYEIALGYGTVSINATANMAFDEWDDYIGTINADNTPAFKLPADNANLNGASAVMLAKLMIDDNLAYTSAMTTLGSNTNYGISSGDKDTMALWQLLFNVRALHMKAGKADATTVPAATLGFPSATTPLSDSNNFLTPTPATVPVIAELDTSTPNLTTGTSTSSGVEFRSDIPQTGAAVNLFDALFVMFGVPSTGTLGRRGVFKLGKTTAGTNKNLLAITRFFHADNPTDANYVYTDDAGEDAVVATRALIVPVNRTASLSGAVSYAINPMGNSFVVITATTPGVANGDNSLFFYLTDPGYAPLQGSSSVNISAGNPTFVSSLYNYTGTLVGVSGEGF